MIPGGHLRQHLHHVPLLRPQLPQFGALLLQALALGSVGSMTLELGLRLPRPQRQQQEPLHQRKALAASTAGEQLRQRQQQQLLQSPERRILSTPSLECESKV